jgi:hypothetical protein
MLGSLVLIFQTAHDSGSLVFRSNGAERTFDSAAAAKQVSQPSVAYAAFSSNIPPEVAPVTAGKHGNLTFNLYCGDMETGVEYQDSENAGSTEDASGVAANPHHSPIQEERASFLDATQALLTNDKLFPDGVALASPLHHVYPIEANREYQGIKYIPGIVKGSDGVLFNGFQDLGFAPEVCIRHEAQKSLYCLGKYGQIEDRLGK